VLADGSRRPGGSAFYSALQAARLGLRTLILTQGSAREIEELLAPYRDELELRIISAPATSTLATSAAGAPRSQRVLAWAGTMPEASVDTKVLHLAPVARETPSRPWRGRADFVGLTPQGLARTWAAEGDGKSGGEIRSAAPDSEALTGGWDALVLSEQERASCAALIAAARAAGATVAITAGADPTALLAPGGEAVRVAVPAIERPRDDLGAGDVFAAAFFVALAEGQPAVRAAAFANAAAAVRVSGVGADAIGDRPAIEARLRASAPAPG
jgi:sugar/nucleoside kinase (ribokinase family)